MKPDSVPHGFPLVPELLDAIPNGIALLDTRLCLVAMNRVLEGMTGFKEDAVRGIYGDFVLRTNLGNHDQVSRVVLENGQTVSRQGIILTRGRKKILDALGRSGGSRSTAAEILSWGRTTLRRKLKKYQLT